MIETTQRLLLPVTLKKMQTINPPLEHFSKAPASIKLTIFVLLPLSIILLLFLSNPFSFSSSTQPLAPLSHSLPISPPPQLPPHLVPILSRTGIINENGFMSSEFNVGGIALWNETRDDDVEDGKKEDGDGIVKVGKYEFCDEGLSEVVPCLDNIELLKRLNLSESVERFERHCPQMGRALLCRVPKPKGYRESVPWPQSRNEVWFSNVPHTRLVEDKGGQNWISIKEDKFVFPGGGTQFIHGADQYLDQISQMVPEIKFGQHTRVALDIGCGVASFGAFLLQRNVTTLSIAPKDVHETQIQFALERGVPAMVSAFATRRLLYPSQAFDLIHCSRCRINWTRDDGILLLEVDRMLRAGGYFAWAAQPVYKHEDSLQEQWKEMETLTTAICWELVKKEGYIAIWRKPVNNACYLNHETGVMPPLCDPSDDPDNVHGPEACITKVPDNGFGTNISAWPERLHHPPDRLQTIKMDAQISRPELLKAESKYWKEIIQSYINGFHWKELKMRNVMDMRAEFGGFAAALHDLQIDCWVMNVVPVSGFNTLPVIYDRGLIGVMHDWCEAFDTYPRTYDLLHAAGLFSIERKRCKISTIMLEMDRILRPNGIAYIRDSITVMGKLQQHATAMGWVCFLHDTGEGPHASWKILRCDKRS